MVAHGPYYSAPYRCLLNSEKVGILQQAKSILHWSLHGAIGGRWDFVQPRVRWIHRSFKAYGERRSAAAAPAKIQREDCKVTRSGVGKYEIDII